MSIKSAAAGRPDFSATVYESAVSTLFSPRQAEWDYLWASDILPPKGLTAHTAYVVPTGYRLLLKGAMVSASKEGIHRIWITSTPGIVGDCRFRYFEALTFPPSSEISAGSTLTIYFKNNSTRVMRGTVSRFKFSAPVTASLAVVGKLAPPELTTPAETQIFADKGIRDTNIHNSSIATN